MTQPARQWASDVIIVGAGASGLLAAQRLSAAGFGVTIVEKAGAGAEQSNHSHGYMHRGHIYLKPSAALVRNLGKGADEWHDLMRQAEVKPVTNTSLVGFINSYESEVAAKAWRASGLDFADAESPESLKPGFRRVFETQEKTYDFTKWIAHTLSAISVDPNVQVVHGTVTKLERTGDRITGVHVQDARGNVVLEASYIVLCAGIGNLSLASSVTRYRGQGLNRTSLMLVLENPDLDEVSLVAHGHETRGLFMVSRTSDTGTVWLVSNYISFASAEITPTMRDLWTRDVRRSLEKFTKALENRRSRWGVYAAPKGELRSLKGTMDAQTVQRYGLENLCVAAPTKLTLAPRLAELITETVTIKLRGAPRLRGRRVYEPARSDLQVFAETWTRTPLESIHSLMTI